MKRISVAVSIFLLVSIALVTTGCSSSAGGDDAGSATVILGPQKNTLTCGSNGTALFNVTTTNIDNGTVGSLTWYTAADKTATGSQPTGVSVWVSTVSNGTAIVSISTTYETKAGSYYFSLTEGTTTSDVGTLTVGASSANSGSGTASGSVTGVSLNYSSMTNIVGTTVQLTVSFQPSDATNQNATWFSSDSSVASVSSSGLVTFLMPGTATITVTSEDGGHTASCTMKVGNIFDKTNGFINNSVNNVYAVGQNIYAATDDGLYITGDMGKNWKLYTTTNGLASNEVLSVFVSGSTIYAATNSGLSASSNAGTTWKTYTTSNGLADNMIHEVYVSGSTIYAATNLGLSISSDSGASWMSYKKTNGLADDIVYSVQAIGSTIYAGTGQGLSISSNGGLTWKNTPWYWCVTGFYVSGSTIYAANGFQNNYLYVSYDGGSNWYQNNTNYPVNDVCGTGSTVYVAAYAALVYSINNGVNWSTASFGRVYGNGVYTTNGLVYYATSGGLVVYPIP